MPHPSHLKAYDEIVPGGGREILDMATREQRHRHRMQWLEMIYPYLGWFAGFAGFLTCVGLAAYLAVNNHEAVAAGLLGVPCFGVIGWFINSRLSNGQSQPPSRGSGSRPPAKNPVKRRR